MTESAPPAQLTTTPRSTLRRKKERGSHERAMIDSILDEGLVAHVGIVGDDGPVVLPMVYARIDDRLYLHGAAGNHLLRTAASATSLCVTVTLVDALVLARSAFHHSVNFRSVVLFGPGELVAGTEEKRLAMAALIDHLVPGRDGQVRPPTDSELRSTTVIRMLIDEGSAKVRAEGPVEEPDDLELPVWAGLVGVSSTFGPITADDGRPATMAVPDHVLARTVDRRD